MMNQADEQNSYIVNLFFDRDGEQTYIVDTHTSLRDMVFHHADLVTKSFRRKLNMEYDFKRFPIGAVDAVVRFEGRSFKHIAFNTKPWSSIDEFKQVRGLIDDYIKETSRRCLKTKRDYEILADFFDTRRALPVSRQKNLSKTGNADLIRLRQDLCSAFKQGMAGLDLYSHITANDFAAVLLSSGLAMYGVALQRSASCIRRCAAPRNRPSPELCRVPSR